MTRQLCVRTVLNTTEHADTDIYLGLEVVMMDMTEKEDHPESIMSKCEFKEDYPKSINVEMWIQDCELGPFTKWKFNCWKNEDPRLFIPTWLKVIAKFRIHLFWKIF